MKSHFPNFHDTRGMSLIEVILFIVMTAVVIFPMTRLARINLVNLGNYATIEKAQSDIQSVMEELIADFGADGFDLCKSEWHSKTGKTNSGLFDYSVSFGANQTANGITYSLATVTVSGGELKDTMTLYTWISKQ